MKHRVISSLDADEDIASAVLWYKRIDANLSSRFLAETIATVIGISQHPYRFALVATKIRRALLKKFPYTIYYSVNYDEVFLIAVVHQRRADRFWMQRDRRRR